jgi:hypothetical protein
MTKQDVFKGLKGIMTENQTVLQKILEDTPVPLEEVRE